MSEHEQRSRMCEHVTVVCRDARREKNIPRKREREFGQTRKPCTFVPWLRKNTCQETGSRHMIMVFRTERWFFYLFLVMPSSVLYVRTLQVRRITLEFLNPAVRGGSAA